MFAPVVAEMRGLDLSGHPNSRNGTWKGAELSKRVVEN
jgi:hypothetical protein